MELDALIGVKKEEDDSSGDVQEDDKEDSLKGTHQLPPPPTTSTAKVVTVFDYCKYDLLMQNKKSMKGQVATTDFSWFSCSKCKKGRINLAAVETHFTSNIFDGHEINGAVCPHCHGNAKDLRICAVCYESNPQSDMFIGCEPCLSVYHECGESFDPPHPIDQWARFPQDFQYKIAENESHKTNDDPEGSNEYANCYYMRTIYLDVVIPLLVSACLILWREVNSKTCAVCKLQHDVSNLLVQCLRTPVMSYILAKEESFKKNGDKFLKDINSLYMSFRHFPEDTMELSADYLKRKLDVPALLDLMHALSPDRAEFLLSQEESEVLRKSRHDSFHVNTMTQILFSDYSAAIRKIVTTLLAKLHKARGRCDLIDIPSESSMLKTFDEASENVVAQPLKHHYRLQVARESERQTLSVVSELLRNEMLGQVGSNSLRIAKMICDTGYKSRLLYIPSLKASVDDESLSRLKYLISYCKWDTVVNSNEINHKVSVALNESFGAAYWKQKSIAYMGRSRGLNDNVTLRKHVYFSVVAAFGPLETDENSLRAIETVLFQLGFGQYPLEVKLEQLCLLATTGNELFASRVLSYIQPTAALQDTKHHSLDLPAIMIDMELVLAYLLPYHKELYGGIVLLPTLVDSSTVAFCTVSKDILVDFKDCLEVMHYGCHDYPTETSIASVRRALGCKEDTSVCDMLHKYPDTVLREEISHFLKGNPAPWYLFAHNRVISRQDLSTITFNRDG
ncbi:hypothetical protein EON65_22490 [archaeon]|nr:MAG: hypothetical protein EON65_22490 [archaeon]